MTPVAWMWKFDHTYVSTIPPRPDELSEFIPLVVKEDIADALIDALSDDLEHGIKSLNEAASVRFRVAYPELSKVIGEINNE